MQFGSPYACPNALCLEGRRCRIHTSRVSQPFTLPSPALRLRRKQDLSNPEPLRILVVDDEETLLQVIVQMLRARYELTIQSFTSSQAAWEELDRTSPDMLIVGGVMPVPCGEEIVRRLMARQDAYPILVVSGHLSAEVVLGWFPDAPNISFLQKPFASGQLFAEIEKHFAATDSAVGD